MASPFKFNSMRFDFSSMAAVQQTAKAAATDPEEQEPEFDPAKVDDNADIVKNLLRTAKIQYKPVAFENACAMAKAIDLESDYFAIVPGSFVFGDLLEALSLKKALKPKRMYITTLGMSPENVDSLVNIHDYLRCEEINLIVSSYYASVERNKNIPYIIDQFAGRNMNLAVCGNHSKISLIERCEGSDFVVFGSANLSSSANLEVFAIIHDPAVVAYVRKVLAGIMSRWTVVKGSTRETIFENNKENRTTDLWKRVNEFLSVDEVTINE